MDFNPIFIPSDRLFEKLTSEIEYPTSNRAYVKKLMMTDEPEEEGVCAATSINVSLVCPLSKVRMTYPCKAKTCKHAQCFDAEQFCKLNAVRQLHKCPVCNKHVASEDLKIDGFFIQVIWELSNDASVQEIVLLPNGRWEPVHIQEIAASKPEATTTKKPGCCKLLKKEKKPVTFQMDQNDYGYHRFVAGMTYHVHKRAANSTTVEYGAQERSNAGTDISDPDAVEVIDLTGDKLNVAFMH